jgi:hypothetical protein
MCSRTSGGVAQAPIATVLDAIKQSDRVFMAGFPSRSDRSSMFVRSLKNAIHRKVTDDFISKQDGLRAQRTRSAATTNGCPLCDREIKVKLV